MDSRSPDAARQRALLSPPDGLGLSDADIAARLSRVGVYLTRDAVGRYRRGEREASAGYVLALLRALDDDEATYLLRAWVADRPGVAVSRTLAEAERPRLPSEALIDVAAEAGRVVGEVRDALSDGRVDEQERVEVEEALGALEHAVAELRRSLAVAVRRSA